MLASGTQDRGFDPGRSRRIFRAKKSTVCLPWGEVKPSPMSQICAACQRTLGLRGSRNHRQNWPAISRPYFRLSLIEVSRVACTWRHLEAKVGTSKGGGKQWQPTPKNLPRMQCSRAVPVAWLGSGSCQNRPSGWILMMMMLEITLISWYKRWYVNRCWD